MIEIKPGFVVQAIHQVLVDQLLKPKPIKEKKWKTVMKTKTKGNLLHLRLRILAYGNSYYIERIARLEKILRKRPRVPITS